MMKESAFSWDFDRGTPAPPDAFLLKWEATDIHDFVWDIADLSSIRGASQLLEEFAAAVIREVLPGAQAVYAAGDQALFLFNGSEEAAIGLGERLVERCREDTFASSAYGVVRIGNLSLGDALSACDAMILQQRLGTIGVDPGAMVSSAEFHHARDPQDGLRFIEAEGGTVFRNGREVAIRGARRTVARMEKGKYGRWDLVLAMAEAGGLAFGKDWNHPFIQDFSGLARPSRPRGGYLAYLSFDGNDFTHVRGECASLADLRALSNLMRAVQLETLAGVLSIELGEIARAYREGSTDTPKGFAQPLQILYLAGDEGDVVVRGERGVDVALDLIDSMPKTAARLLSKGDHGLRPAIAEGVRQLTYSVGLVIAHADTPVSLVHGAADELKEIAKSERRKVRSREAWIDFMVFESHVTTPDSIADWRCDHLDKSKYRVRLTGRPLTGIAFDRLAKLVREAKKAGFPTSLRHRVAKALCAADGPGSPEVEEECKRIGRAEVPKSLRDSIRGQLVADAAGRVSFLDFHELYDWVDDKGGRP